MQAKSVKKSLLGKSKSLKTSKPKKNKRGSDSSSKSRSWRSGSGKTKSAISELSGYELTIERGRDLPKSPMFGNEIIKLKKAISDMQNSSKSATVISKLSKEAKNTECFPSNYNVDLDSNSDLHLNRVTGIIDGNGNKNSDNDWNNNSKTSSHFEEKQSSIQKKNACEDSMPQKESKLHQTPVHSELQTASIMAPCSALSCDMPISKNTSKRVAQNKNNSRLSKERKIAQSRTLISEMDILPSTTCKLIKNKNDNHKRKRQRVDDTAMIDTSTPKINMYPPITSSVLSHESLSSLQDETGGKRIHLKRFLESLTDTNSPPADIHDSYFLPNPPSEKRKCPSSIIQNDGKRLKLNSFAEESAQLAESLIYEPSDNPTKTQCEFKISDEALNTDAMNENNRTKSPDLNHSPVREALKQSHIFSNSSSQQSSVLEKSKSARVRKNKRQVKEKKEPKKSAMLLTLNDTGYRSFDITSTTKSVSETRISFNGDPAKHKKIMKNGVLPMLAVEVNSLTKKLFTTIQKYTSSFSSKVIILRQNIATLADNLISQGLDLNGKDLDNLVRHCRATRLHMQQNLKQIITVGKDYFQAEETHNKKLKHLHRKLIGKFKTSTELVSDIAAKSVEENIVTKARAMLNKLLTEIQFS